MSIVVLLCTKLIESLFQIVRLDLVFFIAAVSPFPFTDIEAGEEHSENHDACEEQSEALQWPKGAIISVLRITGAGQPEHDVEVGTVAAKPDE